MTRISKSPAERRMEILLAAKELFFTQGYNRTSVNDIVKKVGVAQGLFYYYFASKDDIYKAVFELCCDETVVSIQEVLANEEIALNDRIIKAIGLLTNNIESKEQPLMEGVQMAEYLELHNKLTLHSTEMLVEPVADILQRQNENGTLNVQNPNITARFIVYGIWGIMHVEEHAFVKDRENKMIEMYELIARMLNVPIEFFTNGRLS